MIFGHFIIKTGLFLEPVRTLLYVYSVGVEVLEGVRVVDDMSLSVLAVEVQAVVDEGCILCRHVSNNGNTRARGKLYQIETRTLSSATVSRSSPRSPLILAASRSEERRVGKEC